MEDVGSFALDLSQLSAQLRCIYSGAYKRLRYFVERGYDVNTATGPLKIRPLMVACYLKDLKRRIQIVNYLLQNGADPAFADRHGRNSLFYACGLSRVDIVARLLRYADFDVNAADANGNTALHICAAIGNSKIFKMVMDAALKYRLNIWTRNKFFYSPWDIAYSKQHLQCLSFLSDQEGNSHHLSGTALVSDTASRADLIHLPILPSLQCIGEATITDGTAVDSHFSDLRMNTGAIVTLFSDLAVVQKSSSYRPPPKFLVPIDDLWVKNVMGCKRQELSPVDLDKLMLLKNTSSDKTKVSIPRQLLRRSATSPRLQ